MTTAEHCCPVAAHCCEIWARKGCKQVLTSVWYSVSEHKIQNHVHGVVKTVNLAFLPTPYYLLPLQVDFGGSWFCFFFFLISHFNDYAWNYYRLQQNWYNIVNIASKISPLRSGTCSTHHIWWVENVPPSIKESLINSANKLVHCLFLRLDLFYNFYNYYWLYINATKWTAVCNNIKLVSDETSQHYSD